MQKVLLALGERIRELREAKHWSQEEFADLCGLHRTAVGFLERAERNPRLDTLLTISKGWELRFQSFFNVWSGAANQRQKGYRSETVPNLASPTANDAIR